MTTPSALMGTSTVEIPVIGLSGGPMLDGWSEGELVGFGTKIWKGRQQATGLIDDAEFFDATLASAPLAGHCTTIGAAATMNAVSRRLGCHCPGAPPSLRHPSSTPRWPATRRRIVEQDFEDLHPPRVLTHGAFLNAIASSFSRV